MGSEFMSKAKDKPKDKPKPKRRVTDLEALERDYRAGVLSLSELGRLHGGIKKQSVDNIAKREGWTRDLSGKVAQLARSRLSVGNYLDAQPDVLPDGQSSRVRMEDQAVQESAALIVEAVRGHRQDLSRMNERLSRLGLRLDKALQKMEDRDADETEQTDLEKRKQYANELDKCGKLAAALAASYAKVIPLERQAFNVDGTRPGDNQDGELPPSIMEHLAIYQR